MHCVCPPGIWNSPPVVANWIPEHPSSASSLPLTRPPPFPVPPPPLLLRFLPYLSLTSSCFLLTCSPCNFSSFQHSAPLSFIPLLRLSSLFSAFLPFHSSLLPPFPLLRLFLSLSPYTSHVLSFPISSSLLLSAFPLYYYSPLSLLFHPFFYLFPHFFLSFLFTSFPSFSFFPQFLQPIFSLFLYSVPSQHCIICRLAYSQC